jgi:hypothetical protein
MTARLQGDDVARFQIHDDLLPETRRDLGG